MCIRDRIALNDVDTNSDDYGVFLDAVQAAVDAYSGPGTVTLVGNELTFTADADGDVMTPLEIDLSLVDDTLIEGPEDFTIDLTNATSSTGAAIVVDANAGSSTTTINDTQGEGGAAEGPAEFSITGSTEGNEGETVTYTVDLTGSFGEGEVVTVGIGLSDVDTTDADYGDFLAAVQEAVDDYTGDGTVTFDPATGTLTFTAGADGDELAPLVIALDLVDDSLIEGDEDFSVVLTNPVSPTGSNVVLGGSPVVTTTVLDTQGPDGPIDGPGEFSISGDVSVDEGGNAAYQIDLTGTYQAGEQASIQIDLLDGLTNDTDYGSLDLALANAANGFADISYDSATNTLTYTAPTDGATMPTFEFELPIVDDALIEGPENFTIQLSNASSATGLSPVIGDDSVESIIDDTQGEFGATEGPAEFSITGTANADEGSTVSYTVELAGIFGENEVATVDIGLADIDTNSSDYDDYIAAIESAVADYTGDGTLEFDPATGTLTFTAENDGDVMTPLTFEFGLEDDGLIEGSEVFALELTNAGSPTGSSVSVDPAAGSVSTTINDTQGPGGEIEGPAEFSISGPSAGDEGSVATYEVALTGAFGEGESASVDISLNDVDTNSDDYADFLDAVQAAVDDYSGPGTVTLVGNTLTYTAGADGDVMTPLEIDLSLVDDALIEGLEDFSIDLTNAGSSTGAAVVLDPTSSSLTTTINDTQGPGGDAEGPAEFSITGPTTGDEGSVATYELALSGAFGAGEDASVDLSLSDVDTNSDDYADFLEAVQAAVDNYSGPGTVTLVGDTLTFTAGADGDVMTPLTIDLPLVDDGLIEGPEDFMINLSNAGSSTGAAVGIDPTTGSLTTTINDTQGPGGDAEGPAEFSISSPSNVDEGSTAVFTVSLSEPFGAGENASVDVTLGDVDTNSEDYEDYLTALQAAVDAYDGPGTVTLSGTTITFTATNDGDVMTPLEIELPIVDDGLIEGPEDFTVSLANPTSTTGAEIAVDPTAGSSTITIDDTAGENGELESVVWSIEGTGTVQEGGLATYRLTLDGTLQAGEVISVELGLNDLDTDSADHSRLIDAVEAAVAGRDDLTFDPATGELTFTAPSNGTLEALEFSLVASVDGVVEGNEDFEITLSNPSSSTGSEVSIDPNTLSVVSTIISTDLGSPASNPSNNAPPIASDDTAETLIDQPTSGNLFSNDADPEGAGITLVDPTTGDPATGPVTLTTEQGGSVTIDPITGEFTYTPPTGFEGTDTFDYEIVDPNGNTSEASVTLSVIPDQDPSTNNEPNANDDAVVTQLNIPTTGNVLDNDGDLNGDPIVVTEIGGTPVVPGTPTVITTPSGGTLEISDDGTFVYTPGEGFTGTESIEYTVEDDLGGSDTATIHLSTLDPAPIAEDDINTTSLNTPVDGNVLTNDQSDPGDELMVTEVNGVPIGGAPIVTSLGTVVVNPDGTYTYTPTDGATGTDEFTYTVVDENGNESEATVTIEIRDSATANVNTPPVALPDSFETFSDPVSPTTLTSTLLGNDVDPDGDPIVVSEAGGIPAGQPFATPNGGTIIVNPDGTFEYTPAAGFIGEETIEYTIDDGVGGTDTATFTISVTPDADPNSNDLPDANDDVVATQTNTPAEGNLIDNDVDPNGDPLFVSTVLDENGDPVSVPAGGSVTVTTPSGGTLEVFDDGTYLFTPGDDFVGTESIVYTIDDGMGGTDTATLTLDVFDSTPEPMDDFNATSANSPVFGNVLVNDTSDPNDALTVTEVNGIPIGNGSITTDSGMVEFSANGDYVFTPIPGLAGVDTFTYTVVDENGNESQATVTIEIADIGVAQSIVGTPVLLANGNFSVTYQVITENTGAFDLESVSLVEDLAAQLGDVVVSAGNVIVTVPPVNDVSSINVASEWNGTSATQLLGSGSTLAAGDQFTIEYTVELDATELASVPDASTFVTATGNAIDDDGNPVTNFNGDLVSAFDHSDSGTDPNGNNDGEPGDSGESNDSTPLYVPSIGLAKSAGDAVVNGDNFDVTFTFVFENTGNVALTNLSLVDDLAADLGDAFVDVVPGSLSVQNFTGAGVAPQVNAEWESNTAFDLLDGSGQLEVGDSFEVVFTATIDPDAVGSSSRRLDNQGTATGDGINPDSGLADLALTISDVSDSGSNPLGENGEEATQDGTFGNDPTEIVIADLGIAKSIVGEPVLTDIGNFVTTFEVIVENTGTVDLGSLSLVENLVPQFGPAFVDAGNLLLLVEPSDAASSITLDSAGFNGRTNVELISGQDGRLAVGDSFTVRFDVEIDPREVEGSLGNQIAGSAIAVDENGDPIVGSAGVIEASDLSDSGSDPTSTNPGSPGDAGTSDDPLVFTLPGLGLTGPLTGEATGNPPFFPVLPSANLTSISSLLNGFVSSPGPIYSGVPINSNADPLSLESGRPVTGGYSVGDYSELDDCGCAESVDAYGNPTNAIPIEQIIEAGNGCGPVTPQGQLMGEELIIEEVVVPEGDQGWLSEATPEEAEAAETQSMIEQVASENADKVAGNAETLRKPSFLKRFTRWLRG